jgi:pilus assembly protein CpaB
MRSKTIVLLVLALGCGLVASIGISQVLNRAPETAPGETEPVWVAMADIKSGDTLSTQNLKLEQWPKEKIPPGALNKLEQIENKHTRGAIYQGEVVVEKKLRGSTTSHSNEIPPGFRLYTVAGDAVNSHGGLLQPGDRVDVLVFIKDAPGLAQTGTKTILQDIKVFAVNDQTTPPDEKTPDSIAAKTVTLLMTPTQAAKATLAGEIGKIRLVVRGQNDQGTVEAPELTLQDIFAVEKTDRDREEANKDASPTPKSPSFTDVLKQANASSTQKSPPRHERNFSVQIIKGTDISQTDFQRHLGDDEWWEASAPNEGPSSSPAPEPAPKSSTSPSPKKDADGPKPAGTKDAPKTDNRSGGAHA